MTTPMACMQWGCNLIGHLSCLTDFSFGERSGNFGPLHPGDVIKVVSVALFTIEQSAGKSGQKLPDFSRCARQFKMQFSSIPPSLAWLTVVSTTFIFSASMCFIALHSFNSFFMSWLYNNPFSPSVRTIQLVPVPCRVSTAQMPVSTSITGNLVSISACTGVRYIVLVKIDHFNCQRDGKLLIQTPV